jgi:hypothetical protein
MFYGELVGLPAHWAGVRLRVASFTWPLLSSLVTLVIVWVLL